MTATQQANSASWKAARWERKCVVHLEHIDALRVWIDQQPLAFRRAYPARTVCSLYFDTAFLDDFQLNLAGASDRKKLRLRWYGSHSAVKTAVLEVKHKRNQLGIKHAYPVQLSSPLDELLLDSLAGRLAAQLPEEARVLFQRGGLPAVLITYFREYFVSADGRVRLTLDQDIQVYEQRYASRCNDRHRDIFPEVVVLEIKYSEELDTEVRSVLGSLPGRLSRFSKYAVGLQTVLDV